MASLPYPPTDCTAYLVGMARMPYPPTICTNYYLLYAKITKKEEQSKYKNVY